MIKMMIKMLLSELRARLIGHDPLDTAAEWASYHTVLFPCEWAENEGAPLSEVCKFCDNEKCDELSMSDCWRKFFTANPPNSLWKNFE